MRIGQGFDVHAFGEGDFITLGGVRLPFEQGFIAHSDGDVLLHAMADAMLGALSLGDIGHWFPDTEERWRGADSRSLLREVYRQVYSRGYRLVNMDATIIAQAPKMAPHIGAMRRNVAEDLAIDLDRISIKATTSESLGFTGRGEGIAAQSICLLDKVAAKGNT